RIREASGGKMTIRTVSTTAGFALMATAACPAFAQGVDSGAVAELSRLEEIVVTAQKREQNLQEVPLSVSAITAQGFERYASPNIVDLSGAIPNLYIQPTPGGSSILAVSIRGIQYAENE